MSEKKMPLKYYDDLLVGYFSINKTQNFITQKYHWPTFCYDIIAYIIGYDIFLASKIVKHELNKDLQSFSVLIY